jgi:hypothetical protein
MDAQLDSAAHATAPSIKRTHSRTHGEDEGLDFMVSINVNRLAHQ